MLRNQQTTKADLVVKCANTLKNQFLRMNYAIMVIDNENENADNMYAELNDSLSELHDFYLDFPEAFDERESEILDELSVWCGKVGDKLTGEEADEHTEILCELFEYYNGCEE